MAHECRCHHDAPPLLDDSWPVRAEQIVADIVQRHAGALEVMKQMGINHCCGAQLSLREAAAAAGVPLDFLLEALNGRRTMPA